MPDLDKVLTREPRREQTPEQMLAMVKNLNAMFGGSSG